MSLQKLLERIDKQKLYRTGTLAPCHRADDDAETFEVSFSSEEPYERWFGVEVLGHKKGEIDLEWIGSGNAPVLFDHDSSKQIGVIDSTKIKDGRGTAVIRFGVDPFAQDVKANVLAGVRKNISVGYQVNAMELVKENKNGPNEYRVTSWTPLEVSSVAIPADKSVGTDRSEKDKPEPKEEPKMTEEEKAALAEAKRKQDEADAQKRREEEQIRVKDAEQNATEREAQRAADILEMGVQHNDLEAAREAIKSKMPVDAYRTALLDKVVERAKGNVADPSKLSRQEQKDLSKWSLLRAINCEVTKRYDGIEGEMHTEGVRELKAKGLTPQGIVIPPMAMQQRDFTVTTEGTDVVQTTIGSLIDNLTARLVMRDLGAQFLTGLTGDLQLPRRTNAGTVTAEGENDQNAESTLTVDNVTLSPNREGLFYDISKQALIQSSPDVEAFHRNDIAVQMALEVDSRAITAVTGTAGIGTVEAGDPDGGAPSWDNIVDLETQVAIDNADIGSLAYLTNPALRGKLKRTEMFSGTNGNPVWERMPTAPLNGYRALVTTQVSSTGTKGAGTNLSTIIFGNWADLILGMWGGIEIVVDPYTQALNNILRLVVNTYMDEVVRHAESFAVLDDAITT